MSLSRNTIYNVAGTLVPSVLTLVTIPLYLQLIGVERFGVLTLCWVLLGYAGIFDSGLSYATARNIAATKDRQSEPNEVFWTAVWLSLLLGAVGAVLVAVGAAFYFRSIAEAASPLRAELMAALPVLAAAIPATMLGAVMNGALMGRERFLAVNVVAALSQIFAAALPLTIAYFWTTDISVLIAAFIMGRVVMFPWMYHLCRIAVPSGPPRSPSRSRAGELFSFGGWVSLTFVGHLSIQTLDRLLIGSRLGATAVPIYSIPYGLVSRIIVFPHAFSAALFPRFASADQEERERLTANSLEAVVAIITPATIALIAVTDPFFHLWIGPELASASAPIAYVLAGGFWVYCIGHMAFSQLQASGRPDLVAKVLLAELLPYAGLLLVALWSYGVMGAAAAFTARAVLDCLIFLFLAAVPWRVVSKLLLPAALTAAAVIIAATVSHPARDLALGVLFVWAAAHTFLYPPEPLQPYRAKLISLLPNRLRRAG